MIGAPIPPQRVARGSLPLVAGAVLQRLTEAARKPLAVVTAPAGFGKSTLLRAFASARRSAVIIDVAAAGSSFRDVLRTLCDALGPHAPGARLAFASAYARAAERGQRAEPLARWLASYLEQRDVTLVVDGVERLGDELALFADFVEALVTHARHVNVVLGAREDADLPVPRWFARDLMAMPIAPPELRWTVDEARALAEQLGARPTGRSLQRVVEAAGGRAFDIVYWLRTGQLPASGEDPSQTLLAALTADERGYVMRTCLLHRLDDAVLAAAELPSHLMLDPDSRLGSLFVHKAPDGYRYDDKLRARAEHALREDAAALDAVARRSVRALEAVDRVREALDVARSVPLPDELRRLLREHGLSLEDRGDVDAVESALELLEDSDDDDAVVLLLRATRESRLGRSDIAEAWFGHAVRRAESRRVAAEAAYRLAREMVRRDRADAIELLEPYAADDALAPEQRASILSVLAEAYLVARRPDAAREASHRALALAQQLDLSSRAHVYTRASYVELYGGERDRARHYATIGAQLAEEANLYVVAFGAYSVLYNVAYDDAGPAESLVYLDRLGDCAIRSGNLDFHLYAIAAAYELHVERGDLGAIERLERDLREFDVQYAASAALEGLLPSRALVTAWSGEFASAYDVLVASGNQQADPEREALRWSEIALYAAAAGLCDEALGALARGAEAASRADARSQHTIRAAILARLAASLAGEADQLPCAEAPANPRLGALVRAVNCVSAFNCGAGGGDALLDALEDLCDHEFAGMAKLLAALPGPA
jgi:hypothetical protein